MPLVDAADPVVWETEWRIGTGLDGPGDDVANTHPCSQGDIIEEVTWDEVDQKFALTIRNAQNCAGNPEFPSCLP